MFHMNSFSTYSGAHILTGVMDDNAISTRVASSLSNERNHPSLVSEFPTHVPYTVFTRWHCRYLTCFTGLLTLASTLTANIYLPMVSLIQFLPRCLVACGSQTVARFEGIGDLTTRALHLTDRTDSTVSGALLGLGTRHLPDHYRL
jgi:hypothetical protein